MFTNFLKHRTLYLGGFIAFLFIVVFILSLTARKSTQNNFTNPNLPTPTLILPPNSTNNGQPITPTLTSTPNINYLNQDKLHELVTNKQLLSSDQNKIKQNLVNQALPNPDFNLTATNDFSIDYIQALDEFQVEILTTDYKTAENEAVQYFRAQGLSDNSICNLPVMFYLSYDVTQQLKGQNVSVNSIPDFCK